MPNLGLKARSRQVCLGGRRRLRGGPYIALYNHPELARRIEEAGFISSSKAYCHDRSTNSSCSPWRMRRGQGSCGGTTSSTRSLPTSRTRSSTQWAPDGPKRCLSPTRSFPRSAGHAEELLGFAILNAEQARLSSTGDIEKTSWGCVVQGILIFARPDTAARVHDAWKRRRKKSR